jgi:hypothetical protein
MAAGSAAAAYLSLEGPPFLLEIQYVSAETIVFPVLCCDDILSVFIYTLPRYIYLKC